MSHLWRVSCLCLCLLPLLWAGEACSPKTYCSDAGVSDLTLDPSGSPCTADCDCNNQTYEGRCVSQKCVVRAREFCKTQGETRSCQRVDGTCQGTQTCAPTYLVNVAWGDCTCQSGEKTIEKIADKDEPGSVEPAIDSRDAGGQDNLPDKGCVTPSEELCNGKDDDCDGQVDEQWPEQNAACTIPDKKGVCAEGKSLCKDGQLDCQTDVKPASKDSCDGVDDDCDGEIDEGCAQCVPTKLLYRSETHNVRDVAVHPDGSIVGYVTDQKTVQLIDMSGKEVKTHTLSQEVWSVAFSPDGKYLAAGLADGTIMLWTVSDHQSYATMTGHTAAVHALSFSDDSKLLASGAADNKVRLWDVASKAFLYSLDKHRGVVRGIDFDSTGGILASTSDDGFCYIWELKTKTVIAQPSYAGKLRGVAFSPDNLFVLYSTDDGYVRAWDRSKKVHLPALKSHSASVDRIAMEPKGLFLATVSDDKRVLLWDW
ncbi:MAG: hypothetical protein CL920_13905, partial [Deltaproteobacteria bacterium]|nr:hypothetical protein [Deltaproteobacteria bacterium]